MLLFLLLSALRIDGTSSCPAPAELKLRLDALSQGEADGLRGYAAWVDSSPTRIHLELRDPTGRVVASRDLETRASCADRLEACTAIVSAWEAALRSAALSAPPRANPARSPLETPDVPIAVDASRPERPPWRGDVELGAFAGSSGTVGGFFGLQAGLSGAAWGGRLSASFAPAHQDAVGLGVVRWSRQTLGVGPHGVWSFNALSWQPFVEGGLTLLSLRGAGFEENFHATLWEPAVCVGLRVAKSWQAWGAWAEVAATAWPLTETAVIQGPNLQDSLPLAEASVRLGVAAGRW
jgi:hypothetical protein